MTPEFTTEERELIRLVKFFKKRAVQLVEEKKVDNEYLQLVETCNKLVEQLEVHARRREQVKLEREQLKSMIRDNAQCPKCSKSSHLKLAGTDTNEQGWVSNKYRCRSCNIEFVWKAPNNPWDMIPYVEEFITRLESKIAAEPMPDEDRANMSATIEQMRGNVNRLKPIVEASDLDYREMEEREAQMAEIVRQFTKQLMIEKIRTDE